MQPTASICNYQYLDTHVFLHQKTIFKNFIYLDQNLPHPIPKTSADGTHSFVSLTDLLVNE